jgi:hypothetical protein
MREQLPFSPGAKGERGGKKTDNCAYVTYGGPRVISCLFTTAEITRIGMIRNVWDGKCASEGRSSL